MGVFPDKRSGPGSGSVEECRPPPLSATAPSTCSCGVTTSPTSCGSAPTTRAPAPASASPPWQPVHAGLQQCPEEKPRVGADVGAAELQVQLRCRVLAADLHGGAESEQGLAVVQSEEHPGRGPLVGPQPQVGDAQRGEDRRQRTGVTQDAGSEPASELGEPAGTLRVDIPTPNLEDHSLSVRTLPRHHRHVRRRATMSRVKELAGFRWFEMSGRSGWPGRGAPPWAGSRPVLRGA